MVTREGERGEREGVFIYLFYYHKHILKSIIVMYLFYFNIKYKIQTLEGKGKSR